MKVHSGELLFIKSVTDGIPNRDLLNESDARRLFSEEDGRISLSDVSIKRDVRDFVDVFLWGRRCSKTKHYLYKSSRER